ncbi:methionine/alanine import family NSS transporter small subunit [Georgenia wangjunii]
MSVSAIILMLAAMVILWGGLAVATVYLLKHPTPFDAGADDGPGPTSGGA